jgi:hypothetical protein
MPEPGQGLDEGAEFIKMIGMALAARRVTSACRECAQVNDWSDWQLVEVPAMLPLLSIEGDAIPVVCLICTQCGAVRTFSLKALGISMERRRIITPDELTRP